MQDALRDFAHEREWEQFHTPRNLLLALMGEVGEVSELLQWVDDRDVPAWLSQPDNANRLQLELADVLTYLLRLSDVCGVDLEQALALKMQVNEQRYPVSLAKGTSTKYTHLSEPI